MKKETLLIPWLILSICISALSQTRGNFAFTAYNVDGDDDFAIVALADISSNSTIYFTDYDWDEENTIFTKSGNDGFLNWDTGNSTIKAGTIIIFTDIDNESNSKYGASIGTITNAGNINLTADGETILAYVGTDKDTPSEFIAGIKNGAVGDDLLGTGLGGTDLVPGTDFLEFNPTLHPDGGIYTGSKSSQTTYSNYLPLLTDKSNWTRNTEDGEALLPFSTEAFTINTTNWTGATSNVWNLAGNWDNGIPTNSSLVTIPDVSTSPIISSNTTANVGNIHIEANEALTINSENALNIHGNLTISGDLIVQRGGSIIIHGTSSGNLTYNVTVNSTNWHLISSPVLGELYNDAWITTNLIDTNGTGNNNGISTYDNTTGANNWKYFQTGDADAPFNQGQGYALKRTLAGSYGFTGSFPTSDVKQTISQGFGGLNKWNFIGNPFPSYIKVSDLISLNTDNLTDTHESVYVWNGTNYIALNGTDYIQPGQGFFVNADNSNADNFVFSKTLQSHQTGIPFYKNNIPSIQLFMNDGSVSAFTEIVYEANSTTDLDIGSDAGTFTGVPTSFNIYSQLVTNNQGVDFMRQSLPDTNYESMVVPIGIQIDENINASFSISAVQLPNNLKVFIEDKKNKTYIRLDEENTDYKVNLTTSDNGIGRFYIHTKTAATLNTEDVFNLKNIRIYTSDEKTIRISGLQAEKATLKMYSIIGKHVLTTPLITDNNIDVAIPTAIKPGIYIIKITTEKGNINKKVVLH